MLMAPVLLVSVFVFESEIRLWFECSVELMADFGRVTGDGQMSFILLTNGGRARKRETGGGQKDKRRTYADWAHTYTVRQARAQFSRLVEYRRALCRTQCDGRESNSRTSARREGSSQLRQSRSVSRTQIYLNSLHLYHPLDICPRRPIFRHSTRLSLSLSLLSALRSTKVSPADLYHLAWRFSKLHHCIHLTPW